GQRCNRERCYGNGQTLQSASGGDGRDGDPDRPADLRREDGERVALEGVRGRQQTKRDQRVVGQPVLPRHLAEARGVLVADDAELYAGLVAQSFARLLDVLDGGNAADNGWRFLAFGSGTLPLRVAAHSPTRLIRTSS